MSYRYISLSGGARHGLNTAAYTYVNFDTLARQIAVHERIAVELVRDLDETERAQLGALLSKVVDSLPDEPN